MSLLQGHADWLARLRAAAERPPIVPRIPLWWGDAAIGSLAPALFDALSASSEARAVLRPARRQGQDGAEVHGPLTASLAHVAHAMRDAGVVHSWRDEQLAVRDAQGAVLGTVERAAVRPLGIATLAVHLVGTTADGRHWVQQRSFDKPNDPGLWDTLMGGMVPATDSVQEALARETWEEAGLQLAQLEAVAHAGALLTRRPTGDARGLGYIVERIEWFRCRVPDGVVPANQDGEVAQFQLLAPEAVCERLLRGAFTLEASLILADARL